MIILSLQVKRRNLTTFILCPLVALTGFGCYSFPLILITGYDDANRCHNGRSIPDIPFLISTWSSSPISPWGRSNYSSQLTPLFASRGMRSPKWPGRSLNFQFSGIILPPGGTKISLSGTKTCKPVQHKVMQTGRKIFCQWVTRDISGWCHSHFHSLIPGPMSPGYGRSSTLYWPLIQSICSLKENLVQAWKGITTSWCSESSKDHSTVLSSSALGWWKTWLYKWIPWEWGHCITFFMVKWVSWL